MAGSEQLAVEVSRAPEASPLSSEAIDVISDKLREDESGARTGISTVISVVAVVFGVELLVMVALRHLGHAPATASIIVLDAALLALFSAPIIYLVVLRPIRREHETRVLAERKAAMLGRLALTDWLTQLSNRHGIEVALLEAMAISERYRRPLTVALVDLDRFKAVNDCHGHDSGDRVLAQLAQVLSREIRTPDKVGRYGGEEFLLVFPETHIEAALSLVRRIRRVVSENDFELESTRLQLTISVGVTEFRPGENLRELVRRVDGAMYDAKRSGRDRVEIR